MMITLLDPDVNQKICDPACGTGGFLVNSYLHILKKYNSKESNDAGRALGDKLTDKQREFLLNDQLSGFDYEKPMTQFSEMNMILHGFKHPNIKYENSVGKQFNLEEEYDVILANPPFAGNLNKSEIHEDFNVKTTKTELLFCELFYNKLVTGGQAAVIVPAGLLFGSSKKHLEIKKMLLEKCQVEAIVYLPSGVFHPYSGVSTAILFFTKGGSTEKIWLYEMENDGFSLNVKRNPINKNDIPDVLKHFPKKGKSKFAHNGEFKSLSITINDIKENDYNLNVRRYIDNSIPEEQIDIQEIVNKLDDLKKERNKSEEQMIKDLQELRFKV
jgi:type I restriction enzyme M protein